MVSARPGPSALHWNVSQWPRYKHFFPQAPKLVRGNPQTLWKRLRLKVSLIKASKRVWETGQVCRPGAPPSGSPCLCVELMDVPAAQISGDYSCDIVSFFGTNHSKGMQLSELKAPNILKMHQMRPTLVSTYGLEIMTTCTPRSLELIGFVLLCFILFFKAFTASF